MQKILNEKMSSNADDITTELCMQPRSRWPGKDTWQATTGHHTSTRIAHASGIPPARQDTWRSPIGRSYTPRYSALHACAGVAAGPAGDTCRQAVSAALSTWIRLAARAHEARLSVPRLGRVAPVRWLAPGRWADSPSIAPVQHPVRPVQWPRQRFIPGSRP
jgi:hypothetical protein